jgi:hypothetical protein
MLIIKDCLTMRNHSGGKHFETRFDRELLKIPRRRGDCLSSNTCGILIW